MAASDILQRILAVKRDEVAAARAALPLERLRGEARTMPPPRDFVGALLHEHNVTNSISAQHLGRKPHPSRVPDTSHGEFGGFHRVVTVITLSGRGKAALDSRPLAKKELALPRGLRTTCCA